MENRTYTINLHWPKDKDEFKHLSEKVTVEGFIELLAEVSLDGGHMNGLSPFVQSVNGYKLTEELLFAEVVDYDKEMLELDIVVDSSWSCQSVEGFNLSDEEFLKLIETM